MTVQGNLLGYSSNSFTNKNGELKKTTIAYIMVGDAGKDSTKPCAGWQVETVVAFTKQADEFLSKLKDIGLDNDVVVTSSYFNGNKVYDGYIAVV